MSNFPYDLDSNLEIPRVDNNITEVSADAINAIRDAIFAIEKALGINIQGNLSDLATRINSVIDASGGIKTSALSEKGLVTLPIGDAQVGSNAGVQESKLDLDYATTYLNNRISSLQTDLSSVSGSIDSFLTSFTNHYSGVTNKHDGYQIVMNDPTRNGYGTNVENAIHGLDNEFVDHINSTSAHTAYNIPVDNNFRGVSANNVQEALQELSYTNPGVSDHLDKAHSNAILINRRQEVSNVSNIAETTMASTIYQTNTSLSNNMLQVMRPNTARVIGDFIDFGALDSSTAKTLRIYAGGVNRSSIDVDISSIIPTSSTDEIVEKINGVLHSNSNHYPASAYNVNGRLVISHNIPGWEYTIEVLSTATNSAHTALGMSSLADNEYSWADGYCSSYIGGKRVDDFKSLINMVYDHSSAVDLNLITPGDDLRAYGELDVDNNKFYLCNVTNHSVDSSYNGTYYIIGYYGTTGFYLNSDIAQGEFDLEVVADSVSFADSGQGKVFDIFAEHSVDGYGIINGYERIAYNTHTGIDIKSVSNGFPTNNVQWNVTDRQYVKLIEDGESGTQVNIPTGFTGELRVFAPDNVNSVLMEVTGTPATTATHNISVTNFAETDDKMYVSSVHYSGNFGSTKLKYVTDKRKIGGTVENQYQDKLSRIPLAEALGDLRNNGVIRGFNVISNTSSSIRIRGGRALIEGNIIDVKTKDITIDRFTGDKRLLLLDESGNFKTADIDAGGYDESEFIVSDSYGDIRNVCLIADFGTTSTALNGTFTDRRLIISKIDKRLYDVENKLNKRIDNLFNATTGSMWAFTLKRSSDAYGEYLAEINLSTNPNFNYLDDPGFAGGGSGGTTRRFELSNSDGYVTSVFQSPAQTYINIMCQLSYGSHGNGAFGTSGDVSVYIGFNVTTGTLEYYEGDPEKEHFVSDTDTIEQYVRVKTINTTVFPTTDVSENYVVSIPTEYFSNLDNNQCFDILPRIKITGANFIDGGVSGDPDPYIKLGLIRIIGSTYNIAASISGESSDEPLAVTVGGIL